MGGIGGSGISRGDGVITATKTTKIETTAFLPGSRTASFGGTQYKDKVLEETTDGNGNVTEQNTAHCYLPEKLNLFNTI